MTGLVLVSEEVGEIVLAIICLSVLVVCLGAMCLTAHLVSQCLSIALSVGIWNRREWL